MNSFLIDYRSVPFNLKDWKARSVGQKEIILKIKEKKLSLTVQKWVLPNVLEEVFLKSPYNFIFHFFDDIILDSNPFFDKNYYRLFSSNIAQQIINQIIVYWINEE